MYNKLLLMQQGMQHMLSVPLRVRYAVFKPRSKTTGDLGNIEKLASDCVEHAGVVKNDKQFQSITTYDAGRSTEGYIRVQLWELT